jgi:hypothetical protein
MGKGVCGGEDFIFSASCYIDVVSFLTGAPKFPCFVRKTAHSLKLRDSFLRRNW